MRLIRHVVTPAHKCNVCGCECSPVDNEKGVFICNGYWFTGSLIGVVYCARDMSVGVTATAASMFNSMNTEYRPLFPVRELLIESLGLLGRED